MTQLAQLLDGKTISKQVLAGIQRQLQQDVPPSNHLPALSVILVGDDPASQVYVGKKVKACEQLGIQGQTLRLPTQITQAELLEVIDGLNRDDTVHAILVQLPLPRHLDSLAVLQAVSPHKDVDGFHPFNIGRLMIGVEPAALPCTPIGIIVMLDAYHISLEGLNACVLGRSNIVGKPMAAMLTQRNATVTMCHSKTRDLSELVRRSDLVIAALGAPQFVTDDMIKPGAIVVDVGINRLESGKLVGDVDFESVRHHAAWLTPVPGGVGPMTIAMLMNNTVRLYKTQQGLPIQPVLNQTGAALTYIG